MDGPDSGRSIDSGRSFASEWTVMGRSGRSWVGVDGHSTESGRSNKFNMTNTFDKNDRYSIKKSIIYENRSKLLSYESGLS